MIQSDEAVGQFVNDTIVTHSKPLFDGLMAKFGPGAGRTPDLVVCDFSSLGCSDFARAVNATLLTNNPDVLQVALAHIGSSMTPLLRSHEFLGSKEAVLARWNEHVSWGLSGLLSRLERVLQLTLVRILIPLVSGRWSYDGRPASLPYPGQAMFDSSVVLLQDTFFGFESPSHLEPNVAMVGPMLPAHLLARRNRTASAALAFARVQEKEAELSEWLLSSDTPAVYISHGTLFPVADPAKVVALCRGVLNTGARAVYKTSQFTNTVKALVAAGLLPGEALSAKSRVYSSQLFVTRRYVGLLLSVAWVTVTVGGR